MRRSTFLSGTMVLGGLLIAGAGCAQSPQSPAPSNVVREVNMESPVREEMAAKTVESVAPAVATAKTADAPMPASSGRYERYSEEALARANSGDVVIFFKADWCPSCRALDADILSNASSIPSDLTILTLNYDTETELKKKYGVTTQHTLVQVNSAGDMIQKWSGDQTLAAVAKRVQ